MSTPKYTLHPGRHIHRDGERFVFIGRCEGRVSGTGEADQYVSPTDVDAFARLVVATLNGERTP